MRNAPSRSAGTTISTVSTNQVTPRMASMPTQNVRASAKPSNSVSRRRCQTASTAVPTANTKNRTVFASGRVGTPFDDQALERRVDQHQVVVGGQIQGIR